MTSVPRSGSLVVELAALTLWLGASALFAAVVAPALFATLPSRSLAGEVVGRVLPTLLYCGVVVSLLAAAVEAAAGDRLLTARVIMALVIGTSCGAAVMIGLRIDQLRASIGGPIDALAATDPRRLDFGRLHGLSVGALGVGVLAAVALAISAARRLAGGIAAQQNFQPDLEPSHHA